MRYLRPALHSSPIDRRLVLCRTLDALPGLRRGIPPRWGIVRSLALGQRVAVWSARAGQTTRDISVRVSQTSTNVIECASAADDLVSLSTLRLHLHIGLLLCATIQTAICNKASLCSSHSFKESLWLRRTSDMLSQVWWRNCQAIRPVEPAAMGATFIVLLGLPWMLCT